MGSPERAFSRPSKEDDAQTVLYEIDMLRFTRERLLSSKDSVIGVSSGSTWKVFSCITEI